MHIRELKQFFKAKNALRLMDLPKETKRQIFDDFFGGIKEERKLKKLITKTREEIMYKRLETRSSLLGEMTLR